MSCHHVEEFFVSTEYCAMASTQESSQRKKRAWRKPRQQIGPGTIYQDTPHTSSSEDPKPKRVNRDFQSITAPRTEGSSTAAQSSTSTTDTCVEGAPMDESVAERGQSEESACRGVAQGDVPLVIDGSIMEGGGQILRNAMALSCLLSLPLSITRIRAGRGNPGLRPQHLTGIQLLSEMCGGRLEGAGIGSSEVTFHPRAIQGGVFTADTQTAGSVCLLLQAALPCLLFASKSSKVILRGGTNADMAPPIDYFVKVFQPIAAKFGVQFDCKVVRRGFFPKGRGEVIVTTPTGPVRHLTPLTMTDPGVVVRVRIHAFVAGAVSMKMCRLMVSAARGVLDRQLPGVTMEVDEVQETRESAFGNSSGIIIVAETSTGCLLARSANGRKSDPAEKTGRAAADELVRGVRSRGCVDEHLQDQLVILMALAKGRSTMRTGPLTLHTQTAIHIAELMTKAKFTTERVTGEKAEVYLLHCEGIGLENKHL